MENIYETTYNLTTNFYDPANHLSMQGALDLLQNAAARHAFTLGAGKDHLEEKGLFWVIARTELEFASFPYLPIEVKVITWPSKPTRFYFDRFYKIVNANTGEVIVKARSRWVLVDLYERKIVSTTRFSYPLTNFHDEKLFSEDFRRLSEGQEVVGHYQVRPSDIDENGHLNNSKYGSIIYDYLDLMSDEVIKRLVIYYNNEALIGDKVSITVSKEEDYTRVTGVKNDIIIFNSEVEINKWVT